MLLATDPRQQGSFADIAYVVAVSKFASCSPGSTYINPNLGTEEFLGPRGLDVLTCVGQEGELRCGTDDYLPIETARFCQVSAPAFACAADIRKATPQALSCLYVALADTDMPADFS